jgi:hypothetical protein
MDKPSKRKPAKNTLSSKEDMESELSRKLPKPSSWVLVQPAPLTQSEDFALPVGVSDAAAPTFDRTFNVEASSGFYPDGGMTMGIGMGAIKPPAITAHRWMMTKQTQGPTTGTTGIISLRRRLSMWARTLHLLPTPTHEAKAFVHPYLGVM